ncbi:hypothetical protein [Helicobacter sp.]|uniref:hypothetical protein n=1 Tax=Helicobacter sp. TaxID=218 RepID=UPI0019B5184F|nr:hypothetical protein [Helicobacter sp.]MBD5164589.1 hypothetical protein [Helicobacter sp.]
MTKETAQAIFEKVISEKTGGVISTREEAKTQLHNGINPKISTFLKEYENDREKVVEREIKAGKELAASLLKEVK